MPIPAAILGAGISAAGSVGSALVGGGMTKRAAKYAAKANYKFWKLQNEYNHPMAQRERLQAAGLNPNLIYGTSPSSAVGNAGEISPMKPYDVNFENPLRYFNTMADNKIKGANYDNLRAQNTAILQDTALKSAQATEVGLKNAKSLTESKNWQALSDSSLQAMQMGIKNQELELAKRNLEFSTMSQQQQDLVLRTMYEAQNAKETMKGQQLLNHLRQLEINLNKNGIQKTDWVGFRYLIQQGKDVKENLKYFFDLYKGKVKPKKLD